MVRGEMYSWDALAHGKRCGWRRARVGSLKAKGPGQVPQASESKSSTDSRQGVILNHSMEWESEDMDSCPDSASNVICDLRSVSLPCCTSIFSYIHLINIY